GVRVTGERDVAAKHILHTTEFALPEAIAHHGNARAVDLVIGRGKSPSHDGCDAESVKEVERNQGGLYLLRLAVAEKIELPVGEGADFFQRTGLLLNVIQVRP